ncbi:hypothetical protein H8S95_09150 [Pontibacter sp. KCTC 32443]|uniref:hypothetical protein n=1 Tax=Pontibacter TaxID=323449 RepID=UPI00164D9D43|nr:MULTISPECIES: hypothetical protein [Pontibacter]MBC5774228.1 hypothetical protein [Pontibacter sp. KCTC 32443]
MQLYRKHLRNLYLVVGIVLLSATISTAQVKSNLSEKEVSSSAQSKAYYYPQFKKGKVTFITGLTSPGILNYNLLNEEVEFIRAKKDTLALDDMYIVDMITIDKDTFFYDTKSAFILKLLDRINDRKLLIKEQHTLAGTEASNTIKSFYIGSNTDYLPATTANFLKLFPTHTNKLKDYIKENNLELKSEEEIRKLLQYASSL